MALKNISWKLHNRAHWTLAQHISRLAKLLLRNSPDEYVILKIICTFKSGDIQSYDVNRRLDHERRREIVRFLKKHEKELSFFYVQFINFSRRENIRMALSGIAPFEELDLTSENTPNWLHELVNRRFEREISWRHKAWSYLYNHRPFRHSLTRH